MSILIQTLAAANTPATNASLQMLDFADMFQLVIFVYLLYCAVFNKGAVYKNENVEASKLPEYKKVVRIFCFVIAPIGLLSVAFPRLGWGSVGDILGTVFLVLDVIAVVALGVYSYRSTKQYAAKQKAKKK